jgi:hypothetical protein
MSKSELSMSRSDLILWSDLDESCHDQAFRAMCVREGLYKIDLLAPGDNDWRRLLAFGFEEPKKRDEIIGRFIEQEQRSKSTSFFKVGWNISDDQTEEPCDWLESDIGILEQLENADTDKSVRNEGIIHCEIVEFDKSLSQRLLNVLSEHISTYRLSKDADDVTSVCAAIRKYLMMQDPSRLDDCSVWFGPSETEHLDSSVELELLKGINSVVAFRKTELNEKPSDLINAISNVRTQYDNPHILLRENFAAVMIEASVALVLIHALCGDNNAAKAALSEGISTNPDWVGEMIEDQVDEFLEFMDNRNSDLAANLESIIGE